MILQKLDNILTFSTGVVCCNALFALMIVLLAPNMFTLFGFILSTIVAYLAVSLDQRRRTLSKMKIYKESETRIRTSVPLTKAEVDNLLREFDEFACRRLQEVCDKAQAERGSTVH